MWHFSNVNGFGSEILCCNLHPPSAAQVLPYVPKPWGIQCILAQLSLGSHQICRFQHVSISNFRIINLMICFCQSSLLSTHFFVITDPRSTFALLHRTLAACCHCRRAATVFLMWGHSVHRPWAGNLVDLILWEKGGPWDQDFARQGCWGHSWFLSGRLRPSHFLLPESQDYNDCRFFGGENERNLRPRRGFTSATWCGGRLGMLLNLSCAA